MKIVVTRFFIALLFVAFVLAFFVVPLYLLAVYPDTPSLRGWRPLPGFTLVAGNPSPEGFLFRLAYCGAVVVAGLALAFRFLWGSSAARHEREEARNAR